MRKSIIITLFILFFSGILELATRLPLVDYLFPEQGALQDFEFTDFIFSKRSSDTVRNKQITVINFGSLDRRGIARLVDTLNRYSPRIIAIDAFFNCPPGPPDTVRCAALRDPEGSEMLSSAIRRTKTCVLASALKNRTGIFEGDSLEISDSTFLKTTTHGYTSFPITSSVAILRTFLPRLNIMGSDEFAFASQIAWQYDSIKTKRFLARHKEEELINFSGGAFFPLDDQPGDGGAFIAYNWRDVIAKKAKPEHLRGRILILGDMGETADGSTTTDIYFSPLNRKPLGRAYPDITGVVAHANTLATILDYKPINKLNPFGEFLFAFFMCSIHIRLLFWLKGKSPGWYDSLAVALIIAMLSVAAIVRIELFTIFNLKSYLTLTLASLAVSGIAISIYENFEKWWNTLPDEKLDRKFYWISIGVMTVLVVNVVLWPSSMAPQFTLADVWFFGLLVFNLTMFFVWKKRRRRGYKNFMRMVLIQIAITIPLVALYMTVYSS